MIGSGVAEIKYKFNEDCDVFAVYHIDGEKQSNKITIFTEFIVTFNSNGGECDIKYIYDFYFFITS